MIEGKNKRKERMEVMKNRLLKTENPDFELMVSLAMISWGISRRSAIEEINAVAKLEGVKFK